MISRYPGFTSGYFDVVVADGVTALLGFGKSSDSL